MREDKVWAEFTERMSELETLGSVAGVLGWDQQVNLPPAGGPLRGQQMSLLSALLHERQRDPRLGELAALLAEREDPVQATAGRVCLRKQQRATCLPVALVRAQSEATVAAYGAWTEARASRSFAPFAPKLAHSLALLREAVAAYGPADHPYDHLLEDFDPGTRTADLIPLFGRLTTVLPPLVASLAGRNTTTVSPEIPVADLRAISLRVMERFGFNMEAGRLDNTVHPFCSGIGPGDVRLTWKPEPRDPLGTLSGTMHETGHGLYEQGLPDALRGTGLREAAGAAVHESQSRFWENTIGRSEAFCGLLAGYLGEVGHPVSAQTLFRAQNRVQPSLIRVHADEATYNLHVALRFELELALLSGDLPAAELPGAWDAGMERLLGIRPPDVVQGALQDIHWSQSFFGYFPSYTLGNLYAAGLGRRMREDLPDLWTFVAAGDLGPILGWLREKVHQQGRLLDGPSLMRAVIGDRDLVADLTDHLRERGEAAAG